MIDRLEKFLRARLAIEFRLMQEENKKLGYSKYRADGYGERLSEAPIEHSNDEYFRMNGKRRNEILNQSRMFM